MANLSITATAVAPVKIIEQFTGPASVAITAGQYVRFDTTTGQFALGNGTDAAHARTGGIALNTAAIGQTVTAVQKGILDVGNALSALAYDADVYLSDTDGTLATTAGTVTKIVATVVPAFGNTTADKLIRLT